MGKNCHDFDDCKDCCFNNKHCGNEKCDFVKDRVCCCWTVPEGQAQNVYVVVGLNVFASGTISYECGDAASIRVRFFNGNTQVGSTTGVFLGSCLTFTAANFNRIEVECPGSAGDQASDDSVSCSGNICVTPRYQVICNPDNNNSCC